MLQFKNKIEISCKEFAGIQKCNLDKPIYANSDVNSEYRPELAYKRTFDLINLCNANGL